MTALVHDPIVFQSPASPVAREVAERALTRQPGLAWPAKLVAAPDGATGLVSEVPRLVEPSVGAALVRQAAHASLAWLDDDAPDGAPPDDDAASEGLEDLLSEAPHPFRRLDDGGYGLDVAHEGVVGRIEVRATAAGGLWLSARGAVGVGDGRSLPALVAFALEVNRRLRVARLSVGAGGGSAAWLVWDAVLPAGLPAGRALEEGVGAVATARALSEGALRALADPTVAEAFLALRTNRRPVRRRR